MPFGMEKLEWCGYPMVKKMKICLLLLTECTNVTDTQTPHDDIGRACIASRGRKCTNAQKNSKKYPTQTKALVKKNIKRTTNQPKPKPTVTCANCSYVCAYKIVVHGIAQNPDDLPSHPGDNHHSPDVYPSLTKTLRSP